MNPARESERLVKTLCANAHTRKIRSLNIIHEICTEQLDRGSNEFSVATIGRLSAARGGPAAGAIRNKSGEAYRAIIGIFAAASQSKAPKRNATRSTQTELILEGINDPVLRTRIIFLIAELRATRAQLLAARHLANQTTTLQVSIDSSGGRRTTSSSTFTPLEVRALELAISEGANFLWRNSS